MMRDPPAFERVAAALALARPAVRAAARPLAVLWLMAAALPCLAQSPAPAVPYYTPGDFMRGLHRFATAPAAAAFAQQAAALAPAVGQRCAAQETGAALGTARAQWVAAMQAWERLAALAIGPLIERRSLRTLDFSPPRPALIERAIEAAAAGPAAMEEIGAPAKGLPALEWLLWTRPVAPHSPACRYATEVAADIGREAAALATAFAAAAARDWRGEAAASAMSEAINQWLAGLERLRWQDLERPVRAAGDGGPSAPQFPRAASGASAASWAAQWQALRALAGPAGPAPRPGEGLVTIATYLRGRGLNAQADALRRAVQGADASMQGLTSTDPDRLLRAAQALAALKHMLEEQVAPALEIGIGFSDADGD